MNIIRRQLFSNIANTSTPRSKMPTFTIPATMKAIRLHEAGESLDGIHYDVDVEVPTISEDEILIKNKYTGLNFADKFFRSGLIPSTKPSILGFEASGQVVKVGAGVHGYEPSDFIAYLSGSTYAQYTKFNPSTDRRSFKLSKDTPDEKLKLYGGVLTQGFTALTFSKEAYHVERGDYILIHSAAGGVGLLLTQLSKLRGAHVIATASTPEKLALAKEAGAEYLINYSEDVVAKVLEITGGKGVQAAFDSVGKDTFEITFASLAPKATFVSLGAASGFIPPIETRRINGKNFKFVSPNVFRYIAEEDDWKAYSKELKELIDTEKLKLEIYKVYPLEDYKQAATDLEGRKSTGKLLLKI